MRQTCEFTPPPAPPAPAARPPRPAHPPARPTPLHPPPRPPCPPAVKKKESKLYGAHFKDVDHTQKATKVTFDSDDE